MWPCMFLPFHLAGSEQCRLPVLQVDLKLLLYLNSWVLVLKLVLVLYLNTFVGALMTWLDEKDEEMVLLLFPSIFNL